MNKYALTHGSKLLLVKAASEYHAKEEFKRHFKMINSGNIKVTLQKDAHVRNENIDSKETLAQPN